VIFAVSRAGCAAKHPDSKAGIASGGISDLIEQVVGDDAVLKALTSFEHSECRIVARCGAVHPDV